jgi:hypothetical protein
MIRILRVALWVGLFATYCAAEVIAASLPSAVGAGFDQRATFGSGTQSAEGVKPLTIYFAPAGVLHA